MKRKLFMPILALGLILCLMVPGANAWEFSMDGIFTWQYTKAGQLGSNGFFGKYDVDNSGISNGRFASLNGWFGPRFGNVYDSVEMTSGSDAAYNAIYMSTNMQVRINEAIRVRGNYYLAAWSYGVGPHSQFGAATADLVSYGYPAMMFDGVQRSFSPGYWRTLWVTAQIPWGQIALGKRPASFGMGLMADGADNMSSEALSLFAFSGPFRYGWSVYSARRTPHDRYWWGDGPPANDTNAGGYFNSIADMNAMRTYDFGPTLTYRQGPFDIGALAMFSFSHYGPEGSLRLGKADNTPAWDRSDYYGIAYAKYNNGRFFLNYEFDLYSRIQKFSGNETIAGADANFLRLALAPRYIQHYGTALEAGALAGPAKVSLMAAWFSGGDRRNGSIAGINQGDLTGTGVGSTLPTQFSNTSVFRPYSFLAVYLYGLGTSINGATGFGYVDDAMTYGGRLDYAVAANLNVFGTFFWADRVGNAYGWGFMRPGTTASTPASVDNGSIDRAYRGVQTAQAPANVAPNIPDSNLGWEVDAGFDWRLLEGLTLRTTVAYWAPGQWFSYAAMSKTNPNWLNTNGPNLSGGALWGTIPGRSIDPIYGVDFKVEAEF